ncbi:hypothetical protein ONS95_004786 [Cadophora gregata]|uniref:uncharacterized protein n=1 Tax=Cadophora gregata TaxID=51156 RepID=UPI0026DC4C59|nr:uncharacterized protein ONS95_004786 [Cadophora gregata]KAK0104498.1 hypothetical protein ONS95_004786 [Cadophora gregata]
MSSNTEDLCSHCKKLHSLASCPVLEEQQHQAYSQAEAGTSVAIAQIEVREGSADISTASSGPAHPIVEGLTYNGGAYLCADTNNAISDNNNDSQRNGSGSLAPPNPYANTYPTTEVSSSFSSAVGNRFSWADRRSTSAGTVSSREPINSNTQLGNNDNNSDFNNQHVLQLDRSPHSPVKLELQQRVSSLPPVLAPAGNHNNIAINLQHPSQSNGSANNSNQEEFNTKPTYSSPAPASRITGNSSRNEYGRLADGDAASQYGGSSTSEYQEYPSPVISRASGMLPTPIKNFVASSNHGQYFRPANVVNDQRSLPGPYRSTGYANDPAKDSSASSYGQPLNGSNPNLSSPAGQRGNYFDQNGNLAINDDIFHASYRQNYPQAPASPIQQSFNLRPMPNVPHMQDYVHTPTFAVECLKNYANDLQSWAFELTLHTTRLEKVLDLPGQLVWSRDSSFGAKLILQRTPANLEQFNAAIAAGNSSTKALIQLRKASASMNVSPLNFLGTSQQPVGSILGTENNTPEGTPVRGTGRGRGRGGAARGGRATSATKRAPVKRKSTTQDTEDGDDMMGGGNTGSSAVMSTTATKTPARKRGPSKKVKNEPAFDPVDIPGDGSAYTNFPVLAANPHRMADDPDLDAEGETDEEWFALLRRNSFFPN